MLVKLVSGTAAVVLNHGMAVGTLCSRTLSNGVAVGKLAVRDPTQLKTAVKTQLLI